MHELIYNLFESEISKVSQKYCSPKLNHYYNQCDELYEKLRKSLDKEEAKMFNQYVDYVPQIVYEEESRAFLLGMQTGVRLMIEILSGD